MKMEIRNTLIALLASFTLAACSSTQDNEGDTSLPSTFPSSPILAEPPLTVTPSIPVENLLPSDSTGNSETPDPQDSTIVPVTGIWIDEYDPDQPDFTPVENPTLPVSTALPAQPETSPGSSTPIIEIIENAPEEVINEPNPLPDSEIDETQELVLIGSCKGKNTVQLTFSDTRKNNSESIRVHCKQDSFVVKMLLKKNDFPFIKLEPLGQ